MAGEKKGFALIELLVVLLVISVLIALAVPVLQSSRDRARQMVTLSNLRTHGSIFALYTADWNDSYPCFADPDDPVHTISVGGDWVAFTQYFDSGNYWHLALADQYYGGSYQSDVFGSPEDEYPELLAFQYASSLYSRPEFWEKTTREGPSQWRRVLVGDVTYPDRKGVLLTSRLWHGQSGVYPPRLNTPFRVSFADGSAQAILINEAGPGYAGGEGQWPGSVRRYAMQVHHTIGGARGSDLR